MASKLKEYEVPSDDDDDDDKSQFDLSSGSSDEDDESGEEDEDAGSGEEDEDAVSGGEDEDAVIGGEDEDAVSGEEDEDAVSGGEDEDDDEETEAEELDNEGGANIVHFSEDDSEMEPCPICLNKFLGQDLGTPNTCEHTFCFECIKEWSRNINTCPIDRNLFTSIRLRKFPGGKIIRKIAVKVRPKEPEEALRGTEIVCEVCLEGDREDTLLLCDGCDLAFHSECLTPPLSHIPPNAWYCQTCNEVFRNRAGPSSSRRRVIPRTRASEAVRSRVENLRSTRSSAPRSASNSRKSSASARPRKKKRRTYRRTYKKVVQLARTKKDMSNAQKGKLGARGSTIVVTYKARRKRKRRSTKRKFSRRSVASTKTLSAPSSKQRIAKRLGISRPLQGSSVPHVKQTTGSRSGSRVSKMPTHSLFGNRNQLMDFSENFNEDLTNVPSTSRAVPPINRPSNDTAVQSSSGLNILDSIMAGQKLLHCKSDNILIKTDGSLILKETKTSDKKVDNVKNSETEQASRTPMSVALVKTGVKNLTSSSDKKHSSVCQKNSDKSKATDSSNNKSSNSSSKEKIFSKSNSSSSRWYSKSNCSNSKLESSNARKFSDKESTKKLSVIKIPTKQSEISNRKEQLDESDEDVNSLIDGFECDIPSDWESEISSDKPQSNMSNKCIKNRVNSYQDEENSRRNTSASFQKHMRVSCSNAAKKVLAITSDLHIKKEILSDDETDTDVNTVTKQTVTIKEEVLTDEETNIDTWPSKVESRKQVVDCQIIPKIKSEPIDSDSEPDIIKNHPLDLQNIMNDKSSKYNEDEFSDFEASQSIIDTVSDSVSHLSVRKNLNSKLQVRIKEEILSDSEDYSQSLVSTADINIVSQSISDKFNQSVNKSSFTKRSTKISGDADTEYLNELKSKNSKNVSKDNFDLCKASLSAKFLSKSSSKTPDHSFEQEISTENKNKPCTQVAYPQNTPSEDENLPDTQPSSPAIIDSSSEDEAMPCTQIAPIPDIDSSDEDDDLPCTQAVSFSTARQDLSEDDDIPCTQAVSESIGCYVLPGDNDLPCTQAASHSLRRHSSSEDENFPSTQAMSYPVPKDKIIPPTINNNDQENFEQNDIELPATQACIPKSSEVIKVKNKLPSTDVNKFSRTIHRSTLDISIDSDDEIPPTQENFQFLKPSAPPKLNINSPSTTASALNSFTNDDLPQTQKFKTPTTLDNNFNCIKVKKYLNIEELPETQSVAVISESCDLPATQFSNISLKSNSHRAALVDESLDEFPATQLFCPSKKDTSEFQEENSSDESFSLPATQIFNPSSKNNLTSRQLKVVPDDSFSLPATEVSHISKEIHLSETVKGNSESFSLPPTQINNNLPETTQISNDSVRKELSGDRTKNGFSAPTSQKFSSLNDTINLLDTQIDSSDGDLFDLPPTQIANTNSSFNKPSPLSNKLEIKSCGSDSDNNKNISSDSGKEDGTNINDIISNIKLLVNSLSAKDSDEVNLDTNKEDNRQNVSQNENISGDLNCETSESKHLDESSNESLNSENSLDKTSDWDASKKKNEKNLVEENSSEELLSHAELREIANKSSGAAQSKNVGVHRHLPQVIAKIPVKDHVKIKQCNKRTFSFEEVAKIEKIKTPNDMTTNSSRNRSLTELCENIDNDSENEDLPPTQKVNYETSCKTLPDSTKTQLKSTKGFLTELSSRNNIEISGENFENNSSSSTNEENDDFPATQLALNSKSDSLLKSQLFRNASKINISPLVISKTQAISSDIRNKSKSVEAHGNNPMNKESVCQSPDSTNDLPATLIPNSSKKNVTDRFANLDEQSHANEEDSVINKNQNSKSKSNVKIISIRNKASSKPDKSDRSKKSLEFSSLDDLPPTQPFKIPDRKSSNVSKHSNDKGNKKINVQSTSSEISSANEILKKNSKSKDSADEKLKNMRNEFKEPCLEFDLDDFPATQVHNKSSQKVLRNSADIDIVSGRNMKNKETKNKYFETNSSGVSSVSEILKENSIANTITTSNKLKNVSCGFKETSLELQFDDLPATQVYNNVSGNGLENFTAVETVTNKNHESNTLASNEHVKNIPVSSVLNNKNQSRVEKLSSSTDFSVHKRRNSKENDSHKHKKGDSDVHAKKLHDIRSNGNKDHNGVSKRSSEYQKADRESSKNNQSYSYKKLKQTSDKEQVVRIKQEIFNDYEMPSAEPQISKSKDSSTNLAVNGIRIKSENTSDSLPSTQLFIRNKTNMSHGATYNVLSPSSIKKEIYSDDDEISVIEVDTVSKIKVKEEIIIDDEDNEIPYIAEINSSDCIIKCEKEVPSENIIDISSIKKEKCSESHKEILSKSKSQNSNISSKESKQKDSKMSSIKTNEQKHAKDSSVSKHKDKISKSTGKDKNSKEETHKKDKVNDLKSKSKTVSHKDDSIIIKKSKSLKEGTHNKCDDLISKSNTISNKNDSKIIEKSKISSKDSSKEKNKSRSHESDSKKAKSSNSAAKTCTTSNKLSGSIQIQEEKSKTSFDKPRNKNSEKENSSSAKNNCTKNDIIITLKPSKKRSCERSEDKERQKKRKYDYKDSDSCSNDSISLSKIKNNSLKNTDSNIKSKNNSGFTEDKMSNFTPKSDISMDSVKVLKHQDSTDSSVSSSTGFVKKILNKQDLKEEIANEVKIVLKPFFTTGLISKDDYKDIMRRAVPKIFMNCHGCIYPEKIRKLIHSYVALLSKS